MTVLVTNTLRPAWQRWLGVLLMALLLSACADPPRTSALPQVAGPWSGRLALVVEGDAAQSFSAVFLLEGSPERGDLTLSTPLGTALAALHWAPGRAELQSGSGKRTADSLDTLLHDAMGSAIPVHALFAWLQGDAAAAEGWQVDLSHLEAGRLVAVRSQPRPRATLRIALDR